MKIEDSNKYGVLDQKRLTQFERRLGCTLPAEYRRFLIDHNGGKPLPCDFRISADQGENSLHHVYGLHDGPIYLSLEEAFNTYKGRMPKTMIPFADDPTGNAICLGVGGDDLGKVFFWDHELEAEEVDQPFYGNTSVIADSFGTFLNGLFKWVDSEEAPIEKIIKSNDVSALTKLLDSGYDIETVDEHDLTIIEYAAITANNDMIRLLLERGAKVRNALDIAKKNAVFFDDHKATVLLIRELTKKE